MAARCPFDSCHETTRQLLLVVPGETARDRSVLARELFKLNVVEGIGPSADGPLWGVQLGLGASF